MAPSMLSITYVPSFAPAFEIVIVWPGASVVSLQSGASSRSTRSNTDSSLPVSRTNWICADAIAVS